MEITTMHEPIKKKAKVDDKISNKLPTGVQLRRGRYRVRITHPETKNIVWLGTYDTVEEASLVYQNKKDEYRKQYGFTDQYRRPNLIKSDLPTGVYRINNGKFRARVLNPSSKLMVHIGTFETVEDASIAIRNKKEEFEREFGCCKEPLMRRVNVDEICCPRDGDNRVERERAVVEKTKTRAEINIDDRVVDKYARKPECGFHQIGSPTFALEGKNSRNDGVLNNTEKPECGFGHVGSQTSVFEGENSIVESSKRVNVDNDRAFDNLEKPECRFGDHAGFPMSAFKVEPLSDEPISTSTSFEECMRLDEKPKCRVGDAAGPPMLAVKAEALSDEPISTSTSFEECVRLGIIDQYGQLLGEYSKLDDTLWFDNHSKDEATTSIEGLGDPNGL